MKLLLCDTCNTLHRKYEHTLHSKFRTTVGPEGYPSKRKLEKVEMYFCPLDPSHKIRLVEMRRIDNRTDREEFNELFKATRPKHRKQYKETLSKYCSYVDLNEYGAFELLEFRKKYFK